MDSHAALPKSFADLRQNPPEGLELSDRVLDAEVQLDLRDAKITARLLGARMVGGERRLLAAPSPDHAWVVDNGTIRPLPADAPDMLRSMLGGADPGNVPYATAIGLLRAEDGAIPATATDGFSASGQAVAEGLPEKLNVPGLKANLFGYQARGIQWMHDALARTGGLILADEMGLGKTIQIIALLLLEPPSKESPALVVCPTSLIVNWQREIAKFAPSLSVMVHRGSERTGIAKGLQVADVVIATYETVRGDISIFRAFEWSWLICDEAQAIKNPDSARRQKIAEIPRRRTIPMTGTPVENSLLDLWSLMDFAIPGALGERAEFEREHPDSQDSAEQLRPLTEPVMLRRLVTDVASDLPERIDVDVPLELEAPLASLYRSVRSETLEKYRAAGGLVATLRLQLLCAHPRLGPVADDDPDGADATINPSQSIPLMTSKIERTVDLLSEAFRNDTKVLVFALFNRIGDLIREAGDGRLPDAHWGAINGSTEQEQRQQIIDDFTKHDGPGCLILNPKAAGAGLNITAATVVIHYTPVWNPALEAQASARAHRRGQTSPVTVYRLYYESTVEEVMLERLAWKQEMASAIAPLATRDDADLAKALSIEPAEG